MGRELHMRIALSSGGITMSTLPIIAVQSACSAPENKLNQNTVYKKFQPTGKWKKKKWKSLSSVKRVKVTEMRPWYIS